MFQKETDELENVLNATSPEDMEAYLAARRQELADEGRPFAAYMRERFKEKGILQQTVFLKADLPEQYGYRLIGQLKHTRQRDYILRLCLAAGFTLKETQRALKLYGMSELYARIPRDAVLMIALNRGICEIATVNQLLSEHGLESLKGCAEQ